MAHPRIAPGLYVAPQPPLKLLHQFVWLARLLRVDTLMCDDHYQAFIPQALWDKEFTWFADQNPSPHLYFEYQVLLGHLAARAGKVRLGVGVTEAIRRHPVTLAQAMMTLAHFTQRAPIMGIGSGERENTEPYGLDFSQPVGRLEEALQIIRLCFTSQGPFDFEGKHFHLQNAVMDLKPPPNKVPEIWLAAHGPRMLRLTGQYGDGWIPAEHMSPAEYAAKLAIIHQAARAAGRHPAAITPSYWLYTVVAPTEAGARAQLKTRGARFLILLITPATVWRQRGLQHPFGEQYRGFIDFVPHEYDRRQLDAAMSTVPDDLIEDQILWGTPEQVLAKLRAYGEAGMRHAMISLMSTWLSQRATFDALRGYRWIAARLRSGR